MLAGFRIRLCVKPKAYGFGDKAFDFICATSVSECNDAELAMISASGKQ